MAPSSIHFLPLLTLALTFTTGNSIVQLTSQPENVTLHIGETARFNCSYVGTFALPFWYIGGIVYLIGGLPDRHSYKNQMLIVMNVQASDSGRTYRCAFFEVQSRVATLTVLIPEGTDATPKEITNTAVAITNNTIAPTSKSEPTTATTTVETVTRRPKVSSSMAVTTTTSQGSLPASPSSETTLVIASTTAIVGVIILCAVFLIVLIAVLRALYVKCEPLIPEQDIDLYANPSHNSPDNECKETFPDYAEPDAIRSQSEFWQSATVKPSSDETPLDPVYYAIFQGSVSTDESAYKMDQNSAYVREQENYYDEISEVFRLHENCAYGQHEIPQSPNSS